MEEIFNNLEFTYRKDYDKLSIKLKESLNKFEKLKDQLIKISPDNDIAIKLLSEKIDIVDIECEELVKEFNIKRYAIEN